MTTATTTKLEAVNVMMTSIGETPVNTITAATTTDVAIAITILDNVSREVQSVGWHFNIDQDYQLIPNSSLASECLASSHCSCPSTCAFFQNVALVFK